MKLDWPRLFLTSVAAPWVALTLGLIGADPLEALDPSRKASQHHFRQWQLQDGLPQSTIRAIAQDSNGLLWISTHAGLRRFDGVTFSPIDNQPELLKSFHVYSLATDSRGGLWIGTSGGGLLYYSDGEFRHFSPEDGFPGKVIMSLETDGDRVWVGTENSGLVMIEGEEVHHWGQDEHFPLNTIHKLSIGPDGSCWAAVLDSGIFRVSPEGAVSSLGLEDGLPSLRVRAVDIESDGTVWVGFYDGLGRFREGSWRFWTHQEGLPENFISDILTDQHGNLWLGTLGSGVIRLTKDTLEIGSPFADNLPVKVIWTLFEDREGNVWIGSLGNGLGRLSDGPVLPIGAAEGLESEYFNSVVQGHDGTIWAATHGGGLQRYRDGRALPPLTTEEGLSSNSSWSLGFDAYGELWTTTLLPGVDHISAAGVTTYTSQDGLGGSRLLGLLGARDGSVWVAGDQGLSRIHPPEEPGRRRISLFTTADGLVNDQAAGVVQEAPESGRDHIWISTNGGVSVWSEETGFTNYTTANGLRNERVWSILPDGQGGAWLGTFGGGLHRLRNGHVDLVLHTDHGLPSNDVTALVDDGLGYLWLAGTRGLARLSFAELEGFEPLTDPPLGIFRFSTEHGMRNSGVYGSMPRATKAHDDRIFFVSINGLAVVDPKSVEVPSPPRTLVESIRVDGQDQPVSRSLLLPPNFTSLDLVFTTDTLVTPDRIQLRRRLLGLEAGSDAWHALESRNLQISRLPAGSYTLEVEASDAQGRFHGNSTQLEISVSPRFQDTWYFAGLIGILLVTLGIGIQKWRVRHLKAKQIELQGAVDEAIAKIQILKGLLPMCASCKKIRDDDGYWQGVETYITDHSEAAFSHGLCPACAADILQELEIDPGDALREHS